MSDRPQPHRLCNGTTRRDALKLGSLSLLGGFGLSLEGALRLRADSPPAAGGPKREVSCILIWLQGGASTMDMWDMKPDAPSEIRGPFAEIPTAVPGLRICEHLPRCARIMDRVALLRSFSHTISDHGRGDHFMMTGHMPGPGFVDADGQVNNQRPAYGAVVSRALGSRGALPPYLTIPSMPKSGGAVYLGPAAEPFVIASDPSEPDFSVRDLKLALGVDARRLEDRRGLVKGLDRFQGSRELAASKGAKATDEYYRRALELLSSPAAKEAFDIAREDAKLREAYGSGSLGQCCLMARRLVEAGARFVTVDHGNWDTHTKNFESLKDTLLPQLDAALSTLILDLEQRGLLQTTLIIATGEFGRTPRINKDAGRDHWSSAMTLPLAGGGVKGGAVVGASDERAEKPATRPYGPKDLAATVYQLLGVDATQVFHDPLGRPLPILDEGEPIEEIL